MATSRNTRQRAALEAMLRDLDDFVSAQQLHDVLRRQGQAVGLTTVYRNLQLLADEGRVDVVAGPEGQSLYRLCGSAAHHHHLVCRVCGRTVEVSAPDVERWADRVARENGYRDVTHTLEIFGVCPDHDER